MNRWFQTLVKHRPELYRSIYDWNMYPHRWALPAALAGRADGAVIGILETSPSGRQRLSGYFRAALDLPECWWDFQESRRRLALLAPSSLARLAAFSGATLHASRLARIVARSERNAFTNRLGEDAYAFALRRGRLMPPPEALRPLAADTDDLAGDVQRAGWRLLGCCLREEPAAVRDRFRLKAPAEHGVFEAAAPAATPENSWAFLQPIARAALNAPELRCLA